MSWWARRTPTRLTRSTPYVERARHNAGLSLGLFEARPLPLPHGASVRDFPGPLPEAAGPKKLGFERLGAWQGDGGKQGLAVTHPEHPEDIGQMELDGPFGDAQRAGDLFIRKSAHGQLQNMNFTRGERETGKEFFAPQPIRLADVFRLTYIDHDSNGPKVKGTGVTAYIIPGTLTRHIEGTAAINGQDGFTYKVDVTDTGEPGTNDTFAITLSNGYSASGPTLRGGNIQLHVPKPCQ